VADGKVYKSTKEELLIFAAKAFLKVFAIILS